MSQKLQLAPTDQVCLVISVLAAAAAAAGFRMIVAYFLTV